MSPKSQLFEVVARTGKALGSGKRLELLDLLAQMERSVQDLAEAAHLNLTTASAHLQVLRDAGLVVSRRDGTRIFYRLAGPEVASLARHGDETVMARQGTVLVASFHPELTEDLAVHQYFCHMVEEAAGS